MKEKLDSFQQALQNRRGAKGQLIPLLQLAQETYGYIPETAIMSISKTLAQSPADIYGVITFYSQFRLKPLGKYVIKVCDGTACHVNDSLGVIRVIEEELKIAANETTADGLFTLQKVACLGCCSLAPVMMINNETYGKLTNKKVQQVLTEYRRGGVPA